MALKSRAEMDPAYQWDLTAIYPDRTAWETAYAQAQIEVESLSALPGTLRTSRETLKAGLDAIYAAAETVDRLYRYAFLCKAGDNGDPAAQELEGRAISLSVALGAAVSFMDPEILSIPAETLHAWMDDPLLADYRHILENTDRQRAHTLSAEQEKLLSLLQDAAGTPNNVFTMLESVDMTFPDIPGEDGTPSPLTHGTFQRFRESKNRTVRQEAFRVYHGAFQKVINTIGANYAGQVKLDDFTAKVRGYSSPCERSLDARNVPLSVYDSLIAAVHGGIPIMARYLRLRQRMLGLEKLGMCDLYCPMVDNVSYKISLETAKTMVKDALAPLGAEYEKLLDRAFSEGWMDVYENKGKTTGAFSAGLYGVHPYVLLNFTDSLQDVYTMAHELGHAMHSWFSAQCNPYPTHDYEILVAEVASTVNEVLMTKYLLRTETDPRRRAYVLNYLLESFRTTVFRQCLFAEFERQVHDLYQAGTPLTAATLNKVFHDLNVTYYPGVEVDDLADVEWARVPHFYSPFYVYQYATGFCSAVSIADRICETGDPTDYLRFLTTGGSDYPLEELKIAGIDLTKPQVVQRALKVFDETLTELEALLETK